ncbi:DUF748 domain-containing protein [Thalassotalea euphylliae]|uniref:DUF748 domain-containing protein n=1 Tax=Thalassotalea euphylliae TaxID=1655234 RepID=A0A3E0TWQ4_9GAMM|nr:DUF748 domain-containing protein [Thalassotalea euphylliae]REL28425.1 DUF748 domain-containing protein [Thalassotalea euphylliae]
MKIVNKWSTLGVFFIVLLLLVMYASAPVVVYFANKSLAQQNLAVDIQQLTVNPFISAIEVEQFSLNHRPASQQENSTALDTTSMLTLQHLAIKLDTWQLIKGEIHVEFVDLHGIQVFSELADSQVSFSGWQPRSENSTAKPSKEGRAPSGDNTQVWSVRGDLLTLENLSFSLKAKREHTWLVHRLAIRELNASQRSQSPVPEIAFNLALESDFNRQPFNVELTLSHLEKVTQIDVRKFEAKARIEDFMQWLPQDSQLSGMADLASTARLTKTEKAQGAYWQIADLDTQFKLNTLALTLPEGSADALDGSTLKLGDMAINLASEQFAMRTAKPLGVGEPLGSAEQVGASGTGELADNLEGSLLAQLSLHQLNWLLANGDTLAAIEEIIVNDLNVKVTEQAIDIASLSLSNGIISQAQALHSIALNGEQPDALLDIDMLDITALSFTSSTSPIAPAALNIADIALKLKRATVYKSQLMPAENWVLAPPVVPESSNQESTQAVLPAVKTEQSQQASTANLVAKQETPLAEPSETKATDESVTTVHIDNIAISGAAELNMFDYTPSEPVTQRLLIDEFNLKNINSLAPTQASPFVLNGQLGKRAKIEVAGDIYPFTEHLDLNIKGKLSSVNLATYSPYVVDAIGHRISQGQLTSDFALKLQEQQINGEVTTLLKAMALTSAPKKDSKKTSGSLIPINAAIGQLADSQGNIELTFPLTGDINQPNLGIGGLISLITEKALKEGAKNYMIQTFLPYANIITVAMLASDSLFEISMEDLPYQSGQLALLEPQLAYAKQLAAVMAQQESAQVVICPKVNALDITNSAGTAVAEPNIQLIAFGEARLDKFTDHLIEELGIDAERIIHCQARIEDESQAKSRLTFAIK